MMSEIDKMMILSFCFMFRVRDLLYQWRNEKIIVRNIMIFTEISIEWNRNGVNLSQCFVYSAWRWKYSTKNCACNTDKDKARWNRLNTWMLWRHSFASLMQTAVQRYGVMGSTSLVSTRWVCRVFASVQSSVTELCRQRVNVMKETWLEQHFRATDYNSKLNEQQHAGWKLTFVSDLDRRKYPSYDVGTQQTSSMFFLHPSSRHQLQWRLVALTHRSIFRPSHVDLLAGTTGSEPHCAPQ